MTKAKVDWARIVLWDKPGGTHHKAFLMKNDEVMVLQGWEYENRPWKDKSFVKAQDEKGHIGYCLAAALKPTK